jgi:Ribbon-helix-helix protein, copG family
MKSVQPRRSETINVVMRPCDDTLKEDVENAASTMRISVSTFMRDAAREKLERRTDE